MTSVIRLMITNECRIVRQEQYRHMRIWNWYFARMLIKGPIICKTLGMDVMKYRMFSQLILRGRKYRRLIRWVDFRFFCSYLVNTWALGGPLMLNIGWVLFKESDDTLQNFGKPKWELGSEVSNVAFGCD